MGILPMDRRAILALPSRAKRPFYSWAGRPCYGRLSGGGGAFDDDAEADVIDFSPGGVAQAEGGAAAFGPVVP